MRAAPGQAAAGRRLRLGWLLGWALAGVSGTGPAAAADALEDQFSRQWYYTEVVVFQRPLVMDHLSDEALARPPAPLPRNLRWLDAPRTDGGPPRPPSADYALYPITHAYLAFPFLDQALLPEPVAPEPFGSPAGAERSRFGPPSTSRQQGPDAEAPGAARPPGRPAPAIAPRLAPDPLLDFLRELAAFEATLLERSYRWLPPDTFSLAGTARRLARSGEQQVLLHGRWLQPVPPRDAPEPLLFRAAAGPSATLEGTFAVTLGRYLHFDARLYYAEPLLGRAPVNRPQPPAPLLVDALARPRAAALGADDVRSTGVMQLRESRRLRSEELHYLDHPKLGVLVRVEPVPVPESLSGAFARLRAEAEEGDQ